MNVCYPGNCICGAAEWEGDTDCFGQYQGGPNDGMYNAEDGRMTEYYPGPSRGFGQYSDLRDIEYVPRGVRTVLVDSTEKQQNQPEFEMRKILRGGRQASTAQKNYVRGLLDDKIVPANSRKIISQAVDYLPARDAAPVINYLKSLPYRQHRVKMWY